MRTPNSRSNSRNDSRNWLDARISAQILGAFFFENWCGSGAPECCVLGPEKNNKQETHQQNVHGNVPGLSPDCPVIILRFPGNFVCVSLFPQEKHKHIHNFDPHPFAGQSRKVVDVFTAAKGGTAKGIGCFFFFFFFGHLLVTILSLF